MKKAKFVAVMVASLLVLFSCASTGPTEEQQDSIETALVQGNTMQALAELDAAIESYSEQAVYDLDYGMLSFYNGDYENAIAALTEAEGIIENDQVIITRGPLKGHEGLIKKIDRHKRKAYLEMEMFGRKLETQVGLEVVVKR